MSLLGQRTEERVRCVERRVQSLLGRDDVDEVTFEWSQMTRVVRLPRLQKELEGGADVAMVAGCTMRAERRWRATAVRSFVVSGNSARHSVRSPGLADGSAGFGGALPYSSLAQYPRSGRGTRSSTQTRAK
jgi:hypothetical protein